MNTLIKLTCQKYKHVVFSRFKNFQALNIELDLKNTEVLEAQTVSKQVDYGLKMISKFVEAGGGPKSIKRHTIVNRKLLARDRLKLLFDKDSPFLEIGLFAGMNMDYGNVPAAGTIAGVGKIHGKFCIVGANDATVKGGTFFPISVTKQIRIQELSLLNKLPCIYLVDSGGAFLPLQADIFPDRDHGGRTFYNEAILSSLGIPQIAVVCGSSTAGGAYCPTMAEEAIIVKNHGVIFLGGPPLVKAATGEIVSEQDLGGAMMHCSISGCTDYFAETEEEAFEMCRESVLTLHSSKSSASLPYQEPLYSKEDLLVISGKEFLVKDDMYIILSRILDGSQFKEFKAKFGNSLITGFGYIQGILVGILANYGPLTFQDAQKGTHFIQICEKRNIPLCFLQNSGCPDFKADTVSYEALKFRAKMVAAHSCSKVPKIVICISGCYEDDSFTMCGWSFKPNFFFTWPLAHISASKDAVKRSKSSEISILNRLSKSSDIMDCLEDLFDCKTSAFYQASRMCCDGIISPDSTRQVLAICLEIVSEEKENFRT